MLSKCVHVCTHVLSACICAHMCTKYVVRVHAHVLSMCTHIWGLQGRAS